MAMSEDFQLEPSSDDDEFEQVLKIFEASYSRIAKEKGEKTIFFVLFVFVEEDHEGNPLTTVRVYESGRYHRGHWFNANGDAELFCESFDEERVSNFRFRPWED